MLVVQILSYVCVALFLAAVIAKVVKYATTPIHLRWELYPVAHEKGRAGYGGSMFEELDWWTKPRQVDRFNEYKEMFLEIVFLKGVWKHNPRLWVFSFPFHFGLYLIIAWLGLSFLLSILFAAGVSFSAGFGKFVQIVVAVLGYSGLVLTALGALGLLYRRIASPDIRRYSAPIEYINLAFILLVVGVAIAVQLVIDPWLHGPIAYLASLATFSRAGAFPAALQVEFILGSLLLAYIPLTRMAHFIAKYFLYHDVRWSDDPNPRGGKIESKLKQVFGYPMHWRGPHIQTGKSWAEVGTRFEEVKEEKK
jgi:nitrate reductase gamma subunit